MLRFVFLLFLLVRLDAFLLPVFRDRSTPLHLFHHNHNIFEFRDLLTGCGEDMVRMNECIGDNKVVYLSHESDDRCKRIQKRIERLAEDFPNISFYHLPVHYDDYELFMNLRVPTVPYFILYRGGERVFAQKSFDAMLIHKIIGLLEE